VKECPKYDGFEKDFCLLQKKYGGNAGLACDDECYYKHIFPEFSCEAHFERDLADYIAGKFDKK